MSDIIDFKAAKAKAEQREPEPLKVKFLRLARAWKASGTTPKDMTAVLKTKDGITKRLRVPFPPPPKYLQPVYASLSLQDTASTSMTNTKREYSFEGYIDGPGDTLIASYVENSL